MNGMFESKLAPYMQALVEQKRADGFSYHSGELLLKRFDTFCATRFPQETTITYDMVAEWSASRPGEGDAYHNSRISIVKSLSVYILSLGREAYAPTRFSCKAYRPVLYVPSKEDVRELLSKMEEPTSGNAIRKRIEKECKILFSLYFCCGLRLSEGRLLKREHMDMERGILTILESKGHKSRLVYLPPDGIPVMRNYADYIQSVFPDTLWMFPGFHSDKPISCTSVEACFKRYWEKLPVSKTVGKHPTPHCLRHAFVVERMNEWMLRGVDTNRMLPYLSGYLGHKGPDETYYYYHLADKAFDVIRKKDTVSERVIPEVNHYEE